MIWMDTRKEIHPWNRYVQRQMNERTPILLNSLYFNGHTFKFRLQIQKSELRPT